MNAVRMKVSVELLERALRLPEGMEIAGVAEFDDDGKLIRFNDLRRDQQVVLIVSHNAFDGHSAIADMPDAKVEITSHIERVTWKVDGSDLGDGRRGL